MKFSKITVAVAIGLLCRGAQGQEGYTDFFFWRWGHLDGPHADSKAYGISRDGRTAVGSTLVVDSNRAWRSDIDWAIATDDGLPPLYNELQVQEDMGLIAPNYPTAAYAASNMTWDPIYDKFTDNLDWGGSTAVGSWDAKQVSFGVQWLGSVLDGVDEGDFVAIPDFGGGLSEMRIKDVSADGLIIVGYGNNKRGQIGFWADTTIVDTEGVPIPMQLAIEDFVTLQKLQWTRAEAVSADGTIITGYGGVKPGNRAFVATVIDASTDPIALESYILPMLGGGKYAEAFAMIPDGSIIAGRSDSPKGPKACIWFVDETTGAWVIKELGSLSMETIDSVATGIAYKPGSTAGDLMVIGNSRTNQEASEAFIWTGNPTLEDDGIGYFRDLEYILTKTGVAGASSMGSDWSLVQATGISAEGDRIVGWGINPEGGTEAWIVTGYPYDEVIYYGE